MARNRNKNKMEVHCGLKDFYKYYKGASTNAVPYLTYSQIVKDFNSEAMDLIIEKAATFRVPGRLGDVRIKKRKNKMDKDYLKPDWGKTWKMWRREFPNITDDEILKIPDRKLVYHLNDHTDNYYYRFFWEKISCNVKNNTAYSFKPTRTNKIKLTKSLYENSVDYFE